MTTERLLSMEIYYGEPNYSPWGEIQHCDEIYPGMFQVDTASHGGIMVHNNAVPALSDAAQKIGDQYGRYLCYEEDCDATVVFRELLDKPGWQVPRSYLSTREKFIEAIDSGVRHWHQDYLLSRSQMQTSIPDPLAQKGLPELCYCILPSTKELIIVQRGESGYTKVNYSYDNAELNRHVADQKNRAMGVSRAQEEAMLAGSMFGWDVPGADPKRYAEDGTPIKPKRKIEAER